MHKTNKLKLSRRTETSVWQVAKDKFQKVFTDAYKLMQLYTVISVAHKGLILLILREIL